MLMMVLQMILIVRNRVLLLPFFFSIFVFASEQDCSAYCVEFFDNPASYIEYIKNNQIGKSLRSTEDSYWERMWATQVCIDEHKKKYVFPDVFESLDYISFSVTEKNDGRWIVHFYQNYDKLILDKKPVYFGFSNWCLVDTEKQEIVQTWYDK